MVLVQADYALMSAGREGLVATWSRIEGLLADLDRVVASTQDMQADTVTAYQALKARWASAAGERQLVLKALGDVIEQAREHYQQVDASLAAEFGG